MVQGSVAAQYMVSRKDAIAHKTTLSISLKDTDLLILL